MIDAHPPQFRQASHTPSDGRRLSLEGGYPSNRFGLRVLAAATLLRAISPVPYSAVEAKVGAGLLGRWRTPSGEELEQWSGLDATREFGLLADLFGWIEQDGVGQDRMWTLTSSGRQAALMGLQLQARTPRRRF